MAGRAMEDEGALDMKQHHAEFPYTLRGVDVLAEMRADSRPGRIELTISFTRDGKPYEPGPTPLTREELVDLCRAAARSKRE
jgi:hypothetical protein